MQPSKLDQACVPGQAKAHTETSAAIFLPIDTMVIGAGGFALGCAILWSCLSCIISLLIVKLI